MAVDSRYKGNRILKDSGQKPQNAEDKEYLEMTQQQTTFEADAEGGDFRYSENYQNFDPEKKDYQDLEYTYPPFNPPPFDPGPPGPWYPGPVPKKDDPPGGEEDELVFRVNTKLCWCPKKEVTANVVVTPGRVTGVRMSAMDKSKATVSLLSGGVVKIKGDASQMNYMGSMTIVLTINYVRAKTETTGRISTTVEQTHIVPRCSLCCDCATDATIGYTVLDVWVDTEMNLTVENFNESCTYEWTMTGDGSLVPNDDNSIAVYTAPNDNSSCDKTATVSLICNGAVADSIIIRIKHLGAIPHTAWREYPPGTAGLKQYEAHDAWPEGPTPPYWYCDCYERRTFTFCDGYSIDYGWQYGCCGGQGTSRETCFRDVCGHKGITSSEDCEFCNGITDLRNSETTRYGCCGFPFV